MLKHLIGKLNANPILYHGEHFYLMKFGLYVGIGSFFTASLFLSYLASKGIDFGWSILGWYLIASFLVILFSKLFHPFAVGKDFFSDPKQYLSQTAFYNQGGQFGMIVALLLLCYIEKVSYLLLFDAMVYGACFGLFIGRLGCFNYGCCYGRRTESHFAVRYQHPAAKILREEPALFNVNIIPIQLINAGYDLLLFIALTAIYFFDLRDGILSLIFIIFYNLFRVFTNHYRNISSRTNRTQKTIAGIYVIGAIILAILAFFYYRQLPFTPIVYPLSFKFYVVTTFTKLSYLFTSLLSGLLFFVVYSYHKSLGKHV